MTKLQLSRIGHTDLKVTQLGLGGAPLAGLYNDVEIQEAESIILKAYNLGINYFDTAPLYGHGRSELVFGSVLPEIPRKEFVISTKVGRLLKPVHLTPSSEQFVNLPNQEPIFDYSRDGILKSIEQSLTRLKLDYIDIVLIHDADDHYYQALDEAFPTLEELRSQGTIRAIGAGMNQWEMMEKFASETSSDCFLLAGRYTLLDQSSVESFLPICQENNISIIIGGPYNSGILASDLSEQATFDYLTAPKTILDKARKIKQICDEYGIPLKAAALQFGLSHPTVSVTIPGARTESEVQENFEMTNYPIEPGFWITLKEKGLIHKDSLV